MNRSKILIVDDLAHHRLLLAKFCIKLQIDYNEACNGKEAINKIIENHYDLVFMDIEMPVLNGLDAVREIKEELGEIKKKIPIIALTGHETEEFEETFKKNGFSDMLHKPFNINNLQNLLEKFNIKYLKS